MTCCHGPDQLTNAGVIFNLHLGGKGSLVRGISPTNRGVKLFEPCGVGRKWGGAVCSEWDLTKPRVKVLLTEFSNVGMAVDFDIVACLHDVNTIEHFEEVLLLEGHG